MNEEAKERSKQTMILKGALNDKAVKDKCVSCECDTVYDQHHHIDFRIGYVEGAGQLCLECYDKIYVHERQSVTIEDSTLRIATDQTVKDV